MDIQRAILTGIVGFVAGFIKCGFGVGAGIAVLPFVSMIVTPREALALMAPIMFLTDVVTLHRYWGCWDRDKLLLLIPGACLGIISGTIFLAGASTPILRLIIGCIALSFVVLNLWRRRSAVMELSLPPAVAVVAGLAAGLLGALAHASGTVLTIYLLTVGLTKRTFVATLAGVFLFSDAFKVIMYSLYGLLTLPVILSGLAALPLMLLGGHCGRLMNNWLSEQAFQRAINIALLVAGSVLLLNP
jgi:uncharacterized membrane protein YfcA